MITWGTVSRNFEDHICVAKVWVSTYHGLSDKFPGNRGSEIFHLLLKAWLKNPLGKAVDDVAHVGRGTFTPRMLTNCQPIVRIAQNPFTKSTSYQPHIAAVYGSNTCLLARFALRGFQDRVNHNFVHLSGPIRPVQHTVVTYRIFQYTYVSFSKKHTHDQF